MQRSAWFVAFALLGLPGCGGAASNSLGDPARVSGQIANWSGATSYTIWADLHGSSVVVGHTDSTGSFSLTLPGRDQVAHAMEPPAYPPGCASEPIISPPDLKMASILGFSMSDETHPQARGLGLRLISSPSGADITTEFDYVLGHGVVMGDLACPQGTPVYDKRISLDFEDGWNLLTDRVLARRAGLATSLEDVTGPLPPELRWYQIVYP